ncbi:MAG: 3' terminal RNA ribose 2'-O-methyltransferase Hen1, partial [Polyangiaceae bacterium]|nr:3' terminal RNA ribose 2'-O-methyltransferase Hen1 [Polyangiaceae bacterium]
MLLTITSTTHPATDLGYLLHKNPARAQAFELTFGKAHVFYPEATEERCTAALLVEVDPVGLVRGRRGQSGDGLLAQYVNDRPYAGSSLLSVAIVEVFGTAMAGRCKAKQEAADAPHALDARLSVLPCRGGEGLLRRLFEPLGWELTATQHALDEASPDWGLSRYFTIRLTGTKRLSELLSHLYVLVPVLDDDKHYWVADDEVEKLVRHGAGWLAAHPERELIAQRYLKHQPSLARRALERLMQEDIAVADDAQIRHAEEETALERKHSLNEQR